MNDILSFLNRLTGTELKYGIKSPDLDLYDFCFSHREEPESNITIHATCRFKIFYKIETSDVFCFDEHTSSAVFQNHISKLIGMSVQSIALSEKNDLWIDFGAYWIVFVTFEDGLESWRMFCSDEAKPHLVAAATAIGFD